MMKLKIQSFEVSSILLLRVLLFAFCSYGQQVKQGYKSGELKYTKLVNPFVGTSGHGHAFPGTARPFGMVLLTSQVIRLISLLK